METKEATIAREEDHTYLELKINHDNILRIILTDDKPDEIKEAFNQLIIELKKGVFKFDLEDESDDLYHHISSEYISHLNNELQTVYQELETNDLLELESKSEEEE